MRCVRKFRAQFRWTVPVWAAPPLCELRGNSPRLPGPRGQAIKKTIRTSLWEDKNATLKTNMG